MQAPTGKANMQSSTNAQSHNQSINQSLDSNDGLVFQPRKALHVFFSLTMVRFLIFALFHPIFMSFSAIKQTQSKTQREHTENATTTSQSIKFMHRSIHPATLP
jgi:hypothetical protein